MSIYSISVLCTTVLLRLFMFTFLGYSIRQVALNGMLQQFMSVTVVSYSSLTNVALGLAVHTVNVWFKKHN